MNKIVGTTVCAMMTVATAYGRQVGPRSEDPVLLTMMSQIGEGPIAERHLAAATGATGGAPAPASSGNTPAPAATGGASGGNTPAPAATGGGSTPASSGGNTPAPASSGGNTPAP